MLVDPDGREASNTSEASGGVPAGWENDIDCRFDAERFRWRWPGRRSGQ
jgi:hypothetical protein